MVDSQRPHAPHKSAVSLAKEHLARAWQRTGAYRIYHRRFATYGPGTIARYIHEYSRARRNIFFIQVGANDGATDDPYHFFIRRDRWHGIVIEPQPYVFHEKLQATYGGVHGIRLLNVAVDATEGTRPLYRYSFSSSRWATGLASFDKTRLVDNFATPYVQQSIAREGLTVSTNPDGYLTADLVPCVTFDSLLDTMGSDRLDFLITDVEGHDVAILESFPFDRIHPQCVIFELPPRFDEAVTRFIGRLRTHAYDILIERTDALAFTRRATTS